MGFTDGIEVADCSEEKVAAKTAEPVSLPAATMVTRVGGELHACPQGRIWACKPIVRTVY